MEPEEAGSSLKPSENVKIPDFGPIENHGFLDIPQNPEIHHLARARSRAIGPETAKDLPDRSGRAGTDYIEIPDFQPACSPERPNRGQSRRQKSILDYFGPVGRAMGQAGRVAVQTFHLRNGTHVPTECGTHVPTQYTIYVAHVLINKSLPAAMAGVLGQYCSLDAIGGTHT